MLQGLLFPAPESRDASLRGSVATEAARPAAAASASGSTAASDRRALTAAIAGVAGVSVVGAAVTALLVRSGRKAQQARERGREDSAEALAEDPPADTATLEALQLRQEAMLRSPAGIAWGGGHDDGGGYRRASSPRRASDASPRHSASRRRAAYRGGGDPSRLEDDRYGSHGAAAGSTDHPVPVPVHVASHPRFGPAIQGLSEAGVVSRSHLRAVVTHVDALMRHAAALEYCDPSEPGARDHILDAIGRASSARRKVMRRLVRLSAATGIPRVKETNKLIESSLQELLDEIRTGTEETIYNANLVMQEKLEMDVFASTSDAAESSYAGPDESYDIYMRS